MVGVRGVMICQEENFPKQTFIILRGIINIGVLTRSKSVRYTEISELELSLSSIEGKGSL